MALSGVGVLVLTGYGVSGLGISYVFLVPTACDIESYVHNASYWPEQASYFFLEEKY